MRPLIVIRRVPKIDFMRWHIAGFAISLLLTVATVAVFLTAGLNYGIDFTGGTLLEVRTTNGPANLAEMRTKIDALHLASRRCRAMSTRRLGSAPEHRPPAC
jgi:preprotein translocase subunit SecF